MTLQVSFEEFAETAQRVLKEADAYVVGRQSGVIVTAADAGRTTVIAAHTMQTLDEVRAALKKAGFTVFSGTWLTAEEVLTPDLAPTQTYVAAVSYRSSGDKAGVWVDAYPALPTQVTVLKSMYEEFRETGEVGDVTFEEFVDLSNPNVVILTPSNIESFLRQKADC